MNFEEILPKFRRGANIAREKWIYGEYPQRRYIHIVRPHDSNGNPNGNPEIMAVDKYGEYKSRLDLLDILGDDWCIVSGTDYLYEEEMEEE